MTLEVRRVLDVTDIEGALIDLDAVFIASGYEARSRYFAERYVDELRKAPCHIVGFKEKRDKFSRPENDEFFLNEYCDDIALQSADNDDIFFDILERIDVTSRKLKIAIDYTSMSRTWFCGILNWLRYHPSIDSVEVILVYSVGKYSDQYPYRVIEDVRAIPGCEGHPDPTNKSIAVFGLGFDRLAPFAILDDLEPNETYAFLALPNLVPEYASKAFEENEVFLERIEGRFALYPLGSVQNTYTGLQELTSAYKERCNIVLVPLGPKTHVLASILCSMSDPDIACLYATGAFENIIDVEAVGEVCATKILLNTAKPEHEPNLI